MLYGRPPFHHITKPLPKMQAIIDPKVLVQFPSLKEKWEKSEHTYAIIPTSPPHTHPLSLPVPPMSAMH